MKFLAVLIIVFLYRNWIGGNPLREAFNFGAYANWFQQRVETPNVRFVLCVGLPVLVLLLLGMEMRPWLFGLVWLLVSLAVLVYSIDIRDMDLTFDDQSAWLASLAADTSVDSAAQQQSDFKLTVVYETFQNLYPALFWFLVLGPAGALICILSRLYMDQLADESEEMDLVERVVFWLEWPAAKVTGLLFALVGHFGRCFDEWTASLFDARDTVASGLVRAACAASTASEDSSTDLQQFVASAQETNLELRDLLERTLYGWLGIAAIVTILGL
ncbi:MAG: regulatory signaling modulator protein AmpE [Pseudomonadota bacterium]